MSDTVIEVDNLGKLYRLGRSARYQTLGDSIAHTLNAPFKRWKNEKSQKDSPPDYLWALRNVSFQIKKGEIVGIIGRNGAGKTTLLKVLARITSPTEGSAEVCGRVASLLEIGTGFHPELTGRDNIYLNGAILGMKKQEIQRKFDEIVAFAEVEKFIDTPLKHYSSGMYVRLAFAVAAHLESEVFFVDEVLAVGDAAFQKKCLGKMSEVAQVGRTVLFVSHNIAAIQTLCQKGILLETGIIIAQGSTQKVVQHYFQSLALTKAIPVAQRQDRSGDGSVRVVSLKIESMDPDRIIRTSSRLKVTLGYSSEKTISYARFLVGIYDCSNTGIFLLDSDAGRLPEALASSGSVTCVTEPINLTAGRCYVNIAVEKGTATADYLQYAGYFDVEAEDIYGSGKVPGRGWVLCTLKQEWSVEEG